MVQITNCSFGARLIHALSLQPSALSPKLPARNAEPANPQLRARLARQEMLKQQRDRRKNLQKYIPFVARSLAGMLESISEDGVAESVSQDASIIKTMEAYASKDITEDILQVISLKYMSKRVAYHVDSMDVTEDMLLLLNP